MNRWKLYKIWTNGDDELLFWQKWWRWHSVDVTTFLDKKLKWVFPTQIFKSTRLLFPCSHPNHHHHHNIDKKRTLKIFRFQRLGVKKRGEVMGHFIVYCLPDQIPTPSLSSAYFIFPPACLPRHECFGEAFSWIWGEQHLLGKLGKDSENDFTFLILELSVSRGWKGSIFCQFGQMTLLQRFSIYLDLCQK